MIKYLALLMMILNTSYAACEISSQELPPKYGRTLDTIGDSITWTRDGTKLRCTLDEKGIAYDFVGTYLDPYGYRHDGHGGDSTNIVLSRIDLIPKSDTYFILLGVNDINNKSSTPQKTHDNLMLIASKLFDKNQHAKIYISTLLPLDKEENIYNEEVNRLLKSYLPCKNCELIDLGAHFSSQPNWKELLLDKIHPNSEGYRIITDYLAQHIK